MLKHIFKGIVLPTVAALAAGTAVEQANRAGEFLSTAPVNGADNFSSPMMIVASFAAVAAAGVTGYALGGTRKSTVSEPTTPDQPAP